ncbi:ABC transporter permease [Geothrix fuzhouensis]|uniref:ABC transporter permease n=1 Tax=Geothrix fuzhouensis TaxID=2966451 RepID=UPI002149274D|nr:ABC transporter permease [Geothrix fuzhouensis]
MAAPSSELFRFVLGAVAGHRLRSSLSVLGVGIGVAAVVLLSSLGEGTRQYIVSQFSQFGTNLMAINPGKVKTMGIPGVFGGTTHQLTPEDAGSLRRLPGVDAMIPVAMGQGRVEFGGRGRSVYIYGVNHELPRVWGVGTAQGSFLPPLDSGRRASLTVLGPKLAREIFGTASPLGQRVRIGSESLVVIGVMEPKGQLLGFDLDDTAYIPVGTAMGLFNLSELQEIDLLASSSEGIPALVAQVRAALMARHRGEEDFTITTQTEMLDVFGRVIGIVTLAVTAIAGISLVVGAVGILTVMWISVHERTAEIGLLRALGVEGSTVQALFLLEAILLAAGGGVAGLAFGLLVQALLRLIVPGLPLATPPEAVVAALVMTLGVGAAAGVLPARKAASLDPIEALRAE